MGSMIADARGVFSALRDGRTEQASVSMARTDEGICPRPARELRRSMSLLRTFHEEETRQEQARRLVILRRYEYVFAGLIALSVVAVTLYGRRTMKEIGQREEELRRLNTAFEDAIAGIAFVDEEGRLAYANRTLATLLGSEPEELIGVCTETWRMLPNRCNRQSNIEVRGTGKSEVELRCLHRRPALDIRLLRVASLDQDGVLSRALSSSRTSPSRRKRSRPCAKTRSVSTWLRGQRTTSSSSGTSRPAHAVQPAHGPIRSGLSGDVDAAVCGGAAAPRRP